MSPLRLAYEERLKVIAEPLGSIFINNPVVQEVCEKYAHCIILTKEEALYQMIKALCSRQNSLKEMNYNDSSIRSLISPSIG